MTTATALGCPDCDAPGGGGLNFHADSCPLLAASRRRAEWDKDWLDRHSDESGRYRALHPSEKSELRALGLVIPPRSW